MNRSRFLSLAGVALTTLTVAMVRPAAAHDHDRYSVTDLGALPDKPYSGAWQQTLNEKGEVAGFANSNPDDLWYNAYFGDSPFFWKNGTLTSLVELPGGD